LVGNALADLGENCGWTTAPHGDPNFSVDSPPGRGKTTFKFDKTDPWYIWVKGLASSRKSKMQEVTWLALLSHAQTQKFRIPPYRSPYTRGI
jgi:hypothetical protein